MVPSFNFGAPFQKCGATKKNIKQKIQKKIGPLRLQNYNNSRVQKHVFWLAFSILYIIHSTSSEQKFAVLVSGSAHIEMKAQTFKSALLGIRA